MLDRTVATPVWLRAGIWLATPVAGAALLYGLLRLLPVVTGIGWLPLPGWIRAVPEIPEPWGTGGALVAGLLAGLVLASMIDAESMTVRLSGTEVALIRPAHTETVPRAEVAVAFCEKGRLVLLGRTGRELAREPTNLTAGRLARFFTGNGIAWAAQDPYAAAYRRWIPDSPDLPAAVHAVLAAREKALRGGDADDADELRGELGRLGLVLRDRDRRQYWRRVS